MILVNVHAGNGEQAIKTLKKKMQRELVFRNLKTLRFHETNSAKKVRKKQEALRRRKKTKRRQYDEE